MKRSFYRVWLLFLFMFLGRVSAGDIQKKTISGTILDAETKAPVSAYILVAESEIGFQADRKGRFSLVIGLDSDKPVEVILFVYKIGYLRKEVRVIPGKDITIHLKPEEVIHHVIQVTADSGVGPDEGKKVVTLKKMEVYSIPGAAADPIYAAQVLPGVTALPDSSSILIRGGAPEEVCYQFEGVEIEHPFLSETMHEGYFSIFDNQYVEKFNVSTSGFHPRFGDALSGVVDIEARDQFGRKEGGIGLSIMGLNSFAALPFKNSGGCLLSLNKGYSQLMTKINGREGADFQTENLFGKLKFHAGQNLQIRLFGLRDVYSFEKKEDMDIKTDNHLFGLSVQSLISELASLQLTISGSRYNSRFSSVFYSEKKHDDVLQFSLGGVMESGRHFFETGIDAQRRWLTCDGGGENQPLVNEKAAGTRVSFYLNDRIALGRHFLVNIGFRIHSLDSCRFRLNGDPRFALAWMISKDHLLRFSTGVYHQYADYFSLRQAPELDPFRAIHHSLSYDGTRAGTGWRMTIYRKEYRRLPVRIENNTFTNDGYGYAQGIELYLHRETKKWKGIVVYNFLDSRRREGNLAEPARSPWEIPHSLTVILMLKWKKTHFGIRYSLASGLPYTPLADRWWDEEQQHYMPLWGDPYSVRYPSFQRLDLNGNILIPLKKRDLILYFGITNLMNRRNVLRYVYSEDYSTREEIDSIFGRTLFIGLYLPLF